MQRDTASLLDIAGAAQKILAFSANINFTDLANSAEKQSAILYQVIVIGEAVKRLSPDFRERYPDIPWRAIAGMRDVLAHQYDKIDLKDLWAVITTDIPQLLSMIQPLLPDT
ncbi:MAG: DUF86 domain-containing protein [Leptolyngbyaceae cyanobacterium]